MPPVLQWDGESKNALAVNLKNCRGSEFGDALAKIRDVPGRKYDGERKLWLIPAEAGIAERVMQSIQAETSEEIKDWILAGRIKEQEELSTSLPEDAELLIPWANKRVDFQPEVIRVGTDETAFNGLMRHQRPLVDIIARERKLVVADDMGLGKTGAAISGIEEWVLRNPRADGMAEVGPKLVIAPNSVKGSWGRQIEMWLGSDEPYSVVDGATPKKRKEQLETGIREDGWVIVNWEQLRAPKVTVEIKRRNGSVSRKKVNQLKEPLFAETDWLAVVADEVHRAKNRKALATIGLWKVQARGPMLAMSGTPLMNSPDELWSILKWLYPEEYTSYWRFFEDYVDYTDGYMGKVITGVRNPDKLRFELNNRLVRRTQGQVLDLPGKLRIPLDDLKLSKAQRKLYDQAEREMWLEVEQAIEKGDKNAEKFAAAAANGETIETLYKLPNGAARTVRMRQVMESPALLGGEDDSTTLDRCVEMIEDSGDEQWVVFTEFKETPGLLVERLRKQNIKAVAYTGSVSTDDRTRIEREFQAGDIQVVVGTIKSMYQGITLTAAHLQFWVSRDWVPDVNEQGEDRCNRIGQNKRVVIYIAQPENTVATQKIEPLNRLKERIVRSVIYKDNIEEGK